VQPTYCFETRHLGRVRLPKPYHHVKKRYSTAFFLRIVAFIDSRKVFVRFIPSFIFRPTLIESRMFYLILLAFAFGRFTIAADCFQNEQRDGDTPTGDQIGKALTPDLGSICATTFRTGDDQKLQITYNHWSKLERICALL
jgi:hypothetical protein